MRILFAINSFDVAAKRGWHQVIRETWGKDVAPADLRFFIPKSGSYTPLADEVFLDVSAEYEKICIEVVEMLKWGVEHGYDYIMMASTDSYVIPKKVLACGFEKYDYAGDWAFGEQVPFGEVNPIPMNCTFKTEGGYAVDRNLYNWCGCGPVRVLSRKAAAIVAPCRKEAEFWHSADDIMIGQILGPRIKSGEILPYRIPDYGAKMVWHYKHTEKKPYSVEGGWMKKMYEEHK
jgi:hypothetical protein